MNVSLNKLYENSALCFIDDKVVVSKISGNQFSKFNRLLLSIRVVRFVCYVYVRKCPTNFAHDSSLFALLLYR